MTFLKRQNYRHGKYISGCQGSGREGDGCDSKRVTELFCFLTFVVVTQIYTLYCIELNPVMHVTMRKIR